MSRRISRRAFFRLGLGAVGMLAGITVVLPRIPKPAPAAQGGYLVPPEYADVILRAVREGRPLIARSVRVWHWIEEA